MRTIARRLLGDPRIVGDEHDHLARVVGQRTEELDDLRARLAPTSGSGTRFRVS
jgi:hypothetical protein